MAIPILIYQSIDDPAESSFEYDLMEMIHNHEAFVIDSFSDMVMSQLALQMIREAQQICLILDFRKSLSSNGLLKLLNQLTSHRSYKVYAINSNELIKRFSSELKIEIISANEINKLAQNLRLLS
jgi:hypothetical protein